MPRVSEEHSEARREQILGAALRCFAKKGVNLTTVRDICAEAGLSAGALYSYFPAKQHIIEAVFDLSMLENERMFAQLGGIDDPMTALDLVREMSFKAIDDPMGQEIAKAGLSLVAEAIRDPRLAERYAAVQRDMAGRLGKLIAAGQKSGAIDPAVDAAELGRMFLAIHEGWRIQKLADPRLDTSAFLRALDVLLGSSASGGARPSQDAPGDDSGSDRRS